MTLLNEVFYHDGQLVLAPGDTAGKVVDLCGYRTFQIAIIPTAPYAATHTFTAEYAESDPADPNCPGTWMPLSERGTCEDDLPDWQVVVQSGLITDDPAGNNYMLNECCPAIAEEIGEVAFVAVPTCARFVRVNVDVAGDFLLLGYGKPDTMVTSGDHLR